MKKTIKNFTGVLPLGKEVQKNIKGGVAASGTCVLTYTNGNTTAVIVAEFSGSCSQQSSGANSLCVDILGDMNASGDRCRYNCGCDGWES